VISVDELHQMSPAERAELACALAALDATPAEQSGPGAPDEPGQRTESELAGSPRTRVFALVSIIGCCLVLAAWIGVLAVTLPRYYRSGGWRGAWVGFDAGLLVTFAVTAWAGWRHRQLVIACLVVLATLLCCDAWFDVTLDLHTSDFLVSLLMALCVELPLAALALIGARRLMRLNVRAAARTGRVPPLWKIPLYGLESRGFRTLIPAEPCPPVPPGGPSLAAVSPGPAVVSPGPAVVSPGPAAVSPGPAAVSPGPALTVRGAPE
jgi:hypothetical protein